MALSSELISQFVKITNDSNNTVEETTVYGTIVEYEGSNYVRLDGSELLTPITTAANVKPGERVTVMIKNHTATVTGNLSSPSARIADLDGLDDVKSVISEFEIVLAQKVDTEDLVAEQARIDDLIAKDVEITGKLEAAEGDIDILQTNHLTVTERLDAVEADIENLVVNNLDVSVLDAKYAKITDLEATNADVYNLESTYADFEVATTNKFAAVDASITNLDADKLSANDADITYAKITDLDATNADITNLEADVAGIDTLIFGSATGNTIHSSFANAVIAQLGDAQIKSAMIEGVSASKITAGDIITNNVRVMSEDGSLLISDETIQITDENRVRVQIGKDVAGDYSINIWDADGNLMFSKGGITDSAIKKAIIRNDMVSDTANIAAHKLDIDSLFEEINGSTNTIKSTRVYLDDEAQTLDVAFKELETEVTDLGETVTSQGTELSVVQGQIASKVWQQDINTATNEMSTQYSTLEQEVDGISATVSNHTSQISTKADSSTVATVSDRVTTLETGLSGFQSTVSSTYATKTALAATNNNVTTAQNTANSAVNKADAAQADIDALDIGGRNLWYNPNETCEIVELEPGNPTGFDKAYHLTGSNQISINRFNGFTEELVGKQLTMQCWIKYENVVAGINPWNSLNVGKLSMRYTLEDGSVTPYHYDSIIAASITGSSDGWIFMKGTKQLRSDVVSVSLGSSSPRIVLETPESGEAWITGIKLEFGNVATDWTPPPEEVEDDVFALEERVSSAETIISQNAEAIELRALKTEVASAKAEAISTASSDATTKANNALSSANANTAALLENYSTTADMEAAIELKADSITSSVSSTYATKSALATTNNNVTSAKNAADAAQADVDALTKTVTDSYATKSELTQTSNSITSSVSSTYATKSALATTNNNVTAAKNAADAAQEDVDALSETVTNTYATKSELTQTSNSITSSVSSTYATKSALATTNSNVTAAKNAADAAQEDVDALSETVSNTYATKSELTQTSNSITSSVSSTYATKAALATTDANVATAQSTADAAKKKLYHSADGTTATVGYVGFAELTINNNYMNRPICFSLENRGRNASNVEVRFKNANSKDPDLQNLRENGDINVWIEKLETSKWRVIAQKSEGYDTIYVVDYSNNNGNVAVDWVDVHYDTLPTENITASTKLIGSAVASTIATKSEITQLSDRITANVTETTNLGTRMSTVEQTADGLTARLDTAESNIDTAQSTANTAKTNAATAQSTANTAKTNAATAQTTANNAAKTATNYLNFSNSGLVVGDMTASSLGKNVLIDSDSVDIRNGTTTLASFGANTVTLGRNAEDSVIDLCDGAGRISANTAEAATSYPNRNAILIDSQEIEIESVRFVASTSNKYGASSTPTIQRGTELYMTRSSSSTSESCARLKAEHKTTSSGAYTNAGISAMTYDSASTTRAMVYAMDSANSKYNQVNVYPTKTTMNKNLVLNGTTFTGSNKVLWSGVYYMSDTQTATLSEAISAQANGVVLIWSYYVDGAADNSNFQMTYIPKHFITLHPGKGVSAVMTNGTMNVMASKYVYVSDTSIKGYAGNDDAATAKTCGITSTAKNFVLRYVIGV